MRACYIIAEAGSCHDGSLDRALALVKIAEDAGADAIKFQYWSNSVLLALARHDVKLATFYEPYRMSQDWLPILQQEAKRLSLDFMCTCYLEQDIATIASYVDKFKIASPDCINFPFIRAHRQYRKPIIVSLGLLNEAEMDKLDGWCSAYLLHCVSAYPCPLEQLNLSVIGHYKLAGFSDHSGDVRMGAWAFMAGANILEAHIRLDDTPTTNPDYPHALSPRLLKAYIANVRQAQEAWGGGIKITQPAEADTRKYMA